MTDLFDKIIEEGRAVPMREFSEERPARIVLPPVTIYDFYALEFLMHQFADNEELTPLLANIKESVIEVYTLIVREQIKKYIRRHRVVGEMTPEEVDRASLVELFPLMQQTRRSDMERQNTAWEAVIQYLITLEQTNNPKQIVHGIDRIFNAMHNTETKILDKFDNASDLLQAFNFCFDAKSAGEYRGKVSRPVASLLRGVQESVIIEGFKDRIAAAALAGAMAMNPMQAGAAEAPQATHQDQHPREVKALVGEAENQGLEGMRAVASAIRNRKKLQQYSKEPLQGVYGAKRRFKKAPSPEIWKQAEQAWEDSAEQDFARGCQFWGTDGDVEKWKLQPWFKNAKFVFKLQDHNFYRI